ncbi:hypothetical protein ACTHOQ_01590 [Solibacillus silvestris]|uniref:hypothetical protein n=1 Tax=Solibacillus silvestris TaxID=76853 RepID=UPI003F7F8002
METKRLEQLIPAFYYNFQMNTVRVEQLFIWTRIAMFMTALCIKMGKSFIEAIDSSVKTEKN